MADKAIGGLQRKRAYLIPGRAERLAEGLGQLVGEMVSDLCGREIISDFAYLRFSEQTALIGSDLKSEFWHSDGIVIGRSYGAYLILHALAKLPGFPGRVLLLSPVLGPALSKNGLFGSRPPMADRLIKLAEAGDFPVPRSLEIHTGADDNGCDPALAERFASLVNGTRLRVVPNAGHALRDDYVRQVVADFIAGS